MVQLVGLTSEEATQKINELGLEVQYEYEEVDDETQVGKVTWQSIEENQEVSKGSSITIKVAVSKEKVTMINVVGMNIEEATQKLAELGLQVNVTEQNSDDVEQGIIISQMTPEGEEVNIGTTVELLISIGKEKEEEEDSKSTQDKLNEQSTPASVETVPTQTETSTQTIIPETTQQPEEQPVEQPVQATPSGRISAKIVRYININKTRTAQTSAEMKVTNVTDKTLVWSSSNTSVATINQSGVITAKSTGTTTITVTIKNTNITDSFTLTVTTSLGKGDANNDGVISYQDSDYILNMYKYDVELTEDLKNRADMDGNGAINANDAALLMDKLRYG